MTDPYLEMSDLHPNPLNEFATWYAKARAHNIGLAHAMSLATVDKRGRPAARMVLLNEFGPQGFSFYSHYLKLQRLTDMRKTLCGVSLLLAGTGSTDTRRGEGRKGPRRTIGHLLRHPATRKPTLGLGFAAKH